MLTGQDALKEITDESYLTLFSRLRNRAQPELTRQSTTSTKNGHAPPLKMNLLSSLVLSCLSSSVCLSLSLSLSISVWCCGRGVVWCGVVWCVVLCCVVLCCVVLCCVVLCCVCVCVRCGVSCVARFETPCVHSTRLRVYVQNVPVLPVQTGTS